MIRAKKMCGPKNDTDTAYVALVEAIILQAIDDWKTGYICLMKRIGHVYPYSYLLTICCNKTNQYILDRAKLLYSAENFFKSKDFDNYASFIGLDISAKGMIDNIRERANEDLLNDAEFDRKKCKARYKKFAKKRRKNHDKTR